MMSEAGRVLGVDYGRRYVGLALGAGKAIAPYGVLDAKKTEIFGRLKSIVHKESIEKVIVGVSEGKIEEEQRAFAKKLARMLKLPVEVEDETLTSAEAGEKLKGRLKKKGRKKEHAEEATLILERYLNV